MKDLLQDRLNKVANLDDRRMLKNILYDVYGNVVEYNMDMYERLERRIYDEIDDPLDSFYIYTSMDTVQNIDPISDFLHPMIESDLDDLIFDMNEINEKLKSSEEIVLTSVFMKCDISTLTELLARNKTFKGFVRTEKDVYEVSVYLRHCKKYINEIEKLYRVFQHNGTQWNTVNCPYAYKFVDVILKQGLNLKSGDKIKEITVELAEYERYKEVSVVPLWNIKRIEVSDKSFPMPAKDRKNYDHVVSVSEYGSQNGYLVGLDNTDYIYCKRQENDMIIVSSSDEQHGWSLLQIEDIGNSRKTSFPYELMSNRRDLGFIGRYATVKSITVRTKGEMARLLQSYELSRSIVFQGLEILDSYAKTVETINYNDFIDDNIRVDAFKRIMCLKFRTTDRYSFLVQDKMSFLVSEMQILFPEYRCIGELV